MQDEDYNDNVKEVLPDPPKPKPPKPPKPPIGAKW